MSCGVVGSGSGPGMSRDVVGSESDPGMSHGAVSSGSNVNRGKPTRSCGTPDLIQERFIDRPVRCNLH
jgi:hypothetical protein